MINIFVEGAIDKLIIESFYKSSKDIVNCKGKTNMVQEIKDHVRFVYPPQRDEPVSVLIFRDKDEGETHQSICDQFANGLKRILEEETGQDIEDIKFKPLNAANNIYGFSYRSLYFYAILHICQRQHIEEIRYIQDNFKNEEIEDYLLAVALDNKIIDRFAEPRCEFSKESIKDMIISELPEIFMNNKIYPQQKDMLLAYMFATRFLYVKRIYEEKGFIDILMKRILKHNNARFETIFASILKALKIVSDPSVLLEASP